VIILDATTKKLQIVLDGAVTTNQLPFVASYVDVTPTTYVPGENDGLSNSAVAVDIVTAPAASTQRQVKLITVHNADTVAVVLNILYNNSATTRTLFRATLSVGDLCVYTDGEGFRVIDSTGAVKGTGPTGSPGATGPAGSPGPLVPGMDGDSFDWSIPGPAGPPGNNGAPGTPGAPGSGSGTAMPPGVDGEDAFDWWPVSLTNTPFDQEFEWGKIVAQSVNCAMT